MSNTLIVTGSGTTKEAALQEARDKLGAYRVQQCQFDLDYWAPTQTWHAVALAVLEDDLPEEGNGRRGLRGLFGGGK